MKNKKLRQPVSLSLNIDEATVLQKLNDKGISNISVFRKGLKVYSEESIEDLTQGNIS